MKKIIFALSIGSSLMLTGATRAQETEPPSLFMQAVLSGWRHPSWPDDFRPGADVKSLLSMAEAVKSGDFSNRPFPGEQTTPTITVEPGRPIQVTWNHDGQRGPAFRLWLDGAIIKNFLAADLDVVGTSYTSKVGVVPAFTNAQTGAHVLSLTAYNSAGETPKVDLAITVGWTSAPNTPTGFGVSNPKVALNPVTGGVILAFNTKER